MTRERRSRIFTPFAPLALIHAAAGILHRNLLLRPALRNPPPALPLVVIGSLRAGGSGKTPVALELARRLALPGRRIGILVYWLRKNGNPGGKGVRLINRDLAEITPDADWTCCSDEAVLLARKSGARVFATRNREQAWDALNRQGGFDVLISDDGLMDPRLHGAFRLILRRPDENPGVFDLLPAGPYRLTTRILRKVDCIVEGPVAGMPRGFQFRRTLVFPPGFDRQSRRWVICGLGNPEAFRRDLVDAGVHLAGMTRGPDHGLPDLDRVREEAGRAGAAGFICTAKDAVKLESPFSKFANLANPDSLTVIEERIELSPDVIRAVETYINTHPSS